METTDVPEIDPYEAWIIEFCARLNAATDGALATALLANRDVIEGAGTTRAELDEAGRRIVASGKSLFPREYVPVLLQELRKLRVEAAEQRQAAVPTGGDCWACGGSGWVTVPHPACIVRGELRSYPGMRGVCTTAVTCDDCAAGRAMREGEERRAMSLDDAGRRRFPKRPTMTQYLGMRVGPEGGPATHENPVALLRMYEAEKAAQARGSDQRPAAERLRERFPAVAVLMGIGVGGSGTPDG